MSVLVMAAAISFRCSVRRLFSSEWFHERSVSSKINISHACGLTPRVRVVKSSSKHKRGSDRSLVQIACLSSYRSPWPAAGLFQSLHLHAPPNNAQCWSQQKQATQQLRQGV